MKVYLLPILFAAFLVSCDPSADRMNAIDKEIKALRVQLSKRAANETRLIKQVEEISAEYQSVYDSDLDPEKKAKELKALEEKTLSVENERQLSAIETMKGKSAMIRLQLEKAELKRNYGKH
ncbi:MAG: hypothetical protein ACO1N0_00615 [Fluviicola sp.]